MKQVKFLMIALLLILSGSASAQSSKEKFKAVLEDFCESYYDDAFSPRQYIEGSLTVTTVEVDEVNDVIKIRGKHSYRGQYIPFFGRKTHSSVDFKAEVRMSSSGGLKIKFWKWYEPDPQDPKGHWEGPCERTVIP